MTVGVEGLSSRAGRRRRGRRGRRGSGGRRGRLGLLTLRTGLSQPTAIVTSASAAPRLGRRGQPLLVASRRIGTGHHRRRRHGARGSHAVGGGADGRVREGPPPPRVLAARRRNGDDGRGGRHRRATLHFGLRGGAVERGEGVGGRRVGRVRGSSCTVTFAALGSVRMMRVAVGVLMMVVVVMVVAVTVVMRHLVAISVRMAVHCRLRLIPGIITRRLGCSHRAALVAIRRHRILPRASAEKWSRG